MNIVRIIGLLALVVANTVLADVAGTMQVGQGQSIKIYYKDDNHMRMDVGNGTYMLVLKDKAYTVMNQGGQKMVMDMDAMGGAMKAFGGMAMQQAEEQVQEYDPSSIKYKKTGKTETIAGYKGEVYQVSVKGPDGIETSEYVGSDDKDVLALQEAFSKIGARMAKSVMSKEMLSGMDRATEVAAKQGIGGMLRYNQDIVLKSLDNKELADTIFQLPKGAVMMSIPSLGR